METWSQALVANKLDDIVYEEDSDLNRALALIPSQFGISPKATYLGYRSLGLTPQQALQIQELDEDTLYKWRRDDPELFIFEAKYLRELQRKLSVHLLRIGFLRNMTLFIAKDAVILNKAMMSMDELSDREMRYLIKVRSHYTPADLLALEKAIDPEAHQEKVTINLTWGETQEIIEGVQSEYLLDRGKENDYDNGNQGVPV